ncbi:EndoU domain-containing protein [Paenibacillus radicis (ex Xue et al. 2023)]|uniref:EndoU domain-containing protein n=1 Tax=Paenibacillus radicis (ex Xue et al. 2023) TaxID=2972489 RepID=A0ABT1YV25_9BACL|nr:EndoU domain-containing protein [Paenibacillus radicis (ex Xue et al. 2023)]MCR8636795.1 EndoU domain-containing protein [Paenibacillus radicis (ex Xue et al. 2023)]
MPIIRNKYEFKTFEELDNENEYIPIHICYIGIKKYKPGDFICGESLFPYDNKPQVSDLDDDIYVLEYDDSGYPARHALAHIFQGDKRGGYHSSSERGIGDIAEEKDRLRGFGNKGAYKAFINNPSTTPTSSEKSMFPKKYSREKVIQSITKAYINCTFSGTPREWIGKDCEGLSIILILNDEFQIESCWPHEEKK